MKSICKFGKIETSSFDRLTSNNTTVNQNDLPEVINNFLISVNSHIPALNNIKLAELQQGVRDSVVPESYIVEEIDVYSTLMKLKTNKAAGPDLISNKLLKDLAPTLAGPLCAMINSSIREGSVPHYWKESKVIPLPKTYPPTTVEHDIRPIALTNSVAKVAESFVGRWFNEHLSPQLDVNQFGCTHKRSTTHALLKLTNEWFQSSDDSNNITRILFVDFSKAFDLIDHNILLEKFIRYQFPLHITCWSLDFLSGRKQLVQIGNRQSTIKSSTAGVPQGTIAGPNNFRLLIDDLKFTGLHAKYVDDITVSSVSKDATDKSLQESAKHLCNWSMDNGMCPNELKTKEMLLYFGNKITSADVPNITMNSKLIERVNTFKLLGVVISSDLSWDAHVESILNKTAKRMYCIRYLVKAAIRQTDIIQIYCSIIRSVVEYACPVWHPGLSVNQTNELERVQRRCLKIIYPSLSYVEALSAAGLKKLSERREEITHSMFQEIKNPNHPLHYLLPKRTITSSTVIRKSYPYKILITKTTRYGRGFIPYCISKRF